MLQVGDSDSITVRVTREDITNFAILSGDTAPVHLDETFAKAAGFDGVIVHGAYLGALVSRLVGMSFPGPKAILERMDLGFHLPCYVPCDLKIEGTVKQISEAVKTIILDVTITDASGRTLTKGKTWHRIIGMEESHE